MSYQLHKQTKTINARHRTATKDKQTTEKGSIQQIRFKRSQRSGVAI
ncbi:MAG: hypothetical protein J5I59_08205 [Saprospiraceae bacterium]|nr:hypothetical protein [Saprospiraceae bacterium]